MKETKAWAFLAGEKGKEYFVTDIYEMAEIYLKKPKPMSNPFDYGRKRIATWEPTRITILIN